MPAAPGERPAARARMDAAIARLAAAGIEAGGLIGPPEPLTAVGEEYDNARYDEVVVSTLAEGASRSACTGAAGARAADDGRRGPPRDEHADGA